MIDLPRNVELVELYVRHLALFVALALLLHTVAVRGAEDARFTQEAKQRRLDFLRERFKSYSLSAAKTQFVQRLD